MFREVMPTVFELNLLRMQRLKKLTVLTLFAGLLWSCDVVNDDEIPVQGVDGGIEELSFSALTTVTGTFSGQDIALVGDTTTNSLYLAYKVFAEPTSDIHPVVIKKIEVSTRQESIFSYQPQASSTSSRQLLIAGDKLHVVSGRAIYSYDFPLVEDGPVNEVNTNTLMSRFGAFYRNGNIYTLGGEGGVIPEPDQIGDNISLWNIESESFDQVATLPSPKYWADAQLIGNKVYTFGGLKSWNDLSHPQSSIFAYDFSTDNVETYSLPKGVSWTYTALYGNKIIVGGLIRTGDASNADLEIFLGAFDTATNQFQEINHNLDDSDLNTIWDIATVKNKLYVLHGTRDLGTLTPVNWTIFEADLDF